MGTTARVRPGTGTVLGTFFYMWVLVGFVLGTAILLGPIRLITQGMGGAGWERSSHDRMLVFAFLTCLIFSLILTRSIVGAMFRARHRNTRWVVAAVVALLAALTSWEWSNPGKMIARIAGNLDGGTYQIAGGARFIFGSYPDDAKLRALKREGVTSVISLLHTGVVMEREGISAETAATTQLHLRLIRAPLLPWGDDNGQSFDTLRTIARTGRGVFYVHSGLGGDRMKIAKRVIEAEGQRIALAGGLGAGTTLAERSTAFVRGSLTRLDKGKWLLPYPNPQEMTGIVLSGDAGRVISLLDPLDAQQASWNTQMELELRTHSIPFNMRPIGTSDPGRAIEVAREVRQLHGPVLVVAPATPGEDGRQNANTQIALQFLEAYARVAPRSFAARPSWRLARTSGIGTDPVAAFR